MTVSVVGKYILGQYTLYRVDFLVEWILLLCIHKTGCNDSPTTTRRGYRQSASFHVTRKEIHVVDISVGRHKSEI